MMMTRTSSLARGVRINPPRPSSSSSSSSSSYSPLLSTILRRTYAAPSMPRPDPPINNGPLFRNSLSKRYNQPLSQPSRQEIPKHSSPPPPPSPQPQPEPQATETATATTPQPPTPHPIWRTTPLQNASNAAILSLIYDRQALHPSPAETAQFGTDDQVAQHASSFDPSITAPEREFLVLDEECRVGGEADPLLVSPANREVSRLLSPTELGRAVRGDVKMGPSARGWTRKHGVVRVRAVEGDVDVDVAGVGGGGGGGGGKVKVKSGSGRGMSVGGRALGVDRYERLLRGLREVQRRGRLGREGG